MRRAPASPVPGADAAETGRRDLTDAESPRGTGCAQVGVTASQGQEGSAHKPRPAPAAPAPTRALAHFPSCLTSPLTPGG